MCIWASLVAQMVKNPPATQKTWVWSLCQEDPLEGMATLSSILAWRIPMDRGAWRATLHGVAKSWIPLSDQHTLWISDRSPLSGVSVDFLPVCDLPFFYFKILCIFGCAVSLLPLAGFLYRGGGLLLYIVGCLSSIAGLYPLGTCSNIPLIPILWQPKMELIMEKLRILGIFSQ